MDEGGVHREGFMEMMMEQSPWKTSRYRQESRVVGEDHREPRSIYIQQFTRLEAAHWKWQSGRIGWGLITESFFFHNKWFGFFPAVSGKLWKGKSKEITYLHTFFLETLLKHVLESIMIEIGRNTTCMYVERHFKCTGWGKGTGTFISDLFLYICRYIGERGITKHSLTSEYLLGAFHTIFSNDQTRWKGIWKRNTCTLFKFQNAMLHNCRVCISLNRCLLLIVY